MILNIILLVIGFIILIKGADYFIDGASGVAANFKVSKMLIGLTIVAFGTSSPEFAVSVKSIFSNSGDMVLGNVIGSNILNILLIVGASALFHPLTVKNNTIKKELPIVLMITAAFATLMADNLFDKSLSNYLSRGDGIALILFFGVFLYYLIRMTRSKIEPEKEENILSMKTAVALTIFGMAGIIIGSNMVVESASFIAKEIGVSERMIALTIIALGTSLPELVTSIQATRKGEFEIAIGNVVGSNIFNIGIVVGIPVALFGGISALSFSYLDLIVMISSAILLFMFSFNDCKISKLEGILFLLIFVTYYSYVVFI